MASLLFGGSGLYLCLAIAFVVINKSSGNRGTCEPVTTVSGCHTVIKTTTLPNMFGHVNQNSVATTLAPIMQISADKCPSLTQFVCFVFLPPCRESLPDPPPPLLLPCRLQCEAARAECLGQFKAHGLSWPSDIDCQSFPTEHCYIDRDFEKVTMVDNSLRAHRRHPSVPEPMSLAPLEAELGNNDEEFDLEVVSLTPSKVPRRRYDIVELGDVDFFQGWVDVQGTGAANDYCRVIGRGKRKFLSCALAGSTGQDHRYVSKLGFKPGGKNTWFMRDVDDDGRDDYCRCIGRREESKIYCMKAGESGFYGSSVQGGSQFTFELPGSNGCFGKRLNPYHGA